MQQRNSYDPRHIMIILLKTGSEGPLFANVLLTIMYKQRLSKIVT